MGCRQVVRHRVLVPAFGVRDACGISQGNLTNELVHLTELRARGTCDFTPKSEPISEKIPEA